MIAYPIAEAQAQATGHNTMDEVMLLAVHGHYIYWGLTDER